MIRRAIPVQLNPEQRWLDRRQTMRRLDVGRDRAGATLEMKLSASDIAVLSREVAALCTGAQVQRARDGRPGEVLIDMRAPGRTFRLLLAAGSPSARLHLVQRQDVVRPTRGQPPTAFVQLVRKHLLGTRLEGVEPAPSDRVARLTFSKRSGEDETEDEPATTHLLAELTGRHGNLFMLDDSGVILGSQRANVSHRRKLVSGEPYVYPTVPAALARPAGSELDPSQSGLASRQVDEAFERLLGESEQSARQSELERAIRRGIKRVERRLGNLDRDLGRADDADQLRRFGELLQSAYGRVERGAGSAVVPDFYDPELTPVEIPLNPARSLADNIQRYFKEAKRLKAARQQIVERRDRARAELQRLEDAAARVSEISTTGEAMGEAMIDELDTLAGELRRDKLLPRRQQQAAGATRSRAFALPYRTFTSSTGQPILVGRGARQNDQLTFRVGRGRDLWLHVDGSAGAHVIVRLEKGQSVDGDTLAEAAMLAAHFSGQRPSTSGAWTADVRYTLQRNVNKPKGAAPGLVLVAQAKSIAVRIDPNTLQQLFGREVDRGAVGQGGQGVFS